MHQKLVTNKSNVLLMFVMPKLVTQHVIRDALLASTVMIVIKINKFKIIKIRQVLHPQPLNQPVQPHLQPLKLLIRNKTPMKIQLPPRHFLQPLQLRPLRPLLPLQLPHLSLLQMLKVLLLILATKMMKIV